jgi:hypothetical protein
MKGGEHPVKKETIQHKSTSPSPHTPTHTLTIISHIHTPPQLLGQSIRACTHIMLALCFKQTIALWLPDHTTASSQNIHSVKLSNPPQHSRAACEQEQAAS